MATSYFPPKQVSPAANTDTTIHTASTSPTLSSIVSYLSICNQNATTVTIRVFIRVAGAALSGTTQYVAYGVSIGPNETIELLRGAVLGPGDIVGGRTDTTAVSFNLFYAENT